MDTLFRLTLALFLALAFRTAAADPAVTTLYIRNSVPLDGVACDYVSTKEATAARKALASQGAQFFVCVSTLPHGGPGYIGEAAGSAVGAPARVVVGLVKLGHCPSNQQPDGTLFACQSRCLNHLGDDSASAASGFRIYGTRATISNINAQRQIAWQPANAESNPVCVDGCEWSGGFHQYGPLQAFVVNLQTMNVGDYVIPKSPYLSTGNSCVVGVDGVSAPEITNWTQQATKAPTGTGGDGLGAFGDAQKADLSQIKTNTSYGMETVDKLGTIAQQTQASITGAGANGDCGQPVTCEGDAARCEMYFAAREQKCSFRYGNNGDGQGFAQVGANLAALGTMSTRDALKADDNTHSLSAHMNRQRFMPSGSCPQPMQLRFFERDFTVGFEPLCYVANLVSFFLVAGACYVGLRIFLPAL